MMAQLPTPTGGEVLVWIGCLGIVLTLGEKVFNLYQRFTGKRPGMDVHPQPLEVREADTFAREKDCLARNSALQKHVDDLWRGRSADTRESSIHRKSMYDKVESVRAELTDKIEDVRKELSDKIENTPNQVVATLVNTRAIWGEPKKGI